MKKLLTILFLLFALPAYAVTATFQEGVSSYAGTTDNQLVESDPTTNYDGSSLTHPHAFTNFPYTNLIKFDLTSITGPVTVSAASLEVVIKSGLSNDGCISHIRRLKRDWGETTSTWNTYDGSNGWGTAGALNTTTDITASDDASNTASGITAPTTITISGLEALVEGWINGDYPNYGMLLFSNAEGDAVGVAGDSEDATSSNRPLLTVTYTVVETPATTSNASLSGGTFNNANLN